MKISKSSNPISVRELLENKRYFLSCDDKQDPARIDKSSIGDIDKVSTGRERFLKRQNKYANIKQEMQKRSIAANVVTS